mmetsp:Transcript_7824/g.32684  ORF Transcript_7824/g.32684 Transcript_7824/m.32684 type:complete len:94 (-) Transcript_7824:52-333(-)
MREEERSAFFPRADDDSLHIFYKRFTRTDDDDDDAASLSSPETRFPRAARIHDYKIGAAPSDADFVSERAEIRSPCDGSARRSKARALFGDVR